jgi:hypothetical protein
MRWANFPDGNAPTNETHGAAGLLQFLPLLQEQLRCFFQSVLQSGAQEPTRKVWDCLTEQWSQLLQEFRHVLVQAHRLGGLLPCVGFTGHKHTLAGGTSLGDLECNSHPRAPARKNSTGFTGGCKAPDIELQKATKSSFSLD